MRVPVPPRVRWIAGAALLWYLAWLLVFCLQVFGPLDLADAPVLWRQPVDLVDAPLPTWLHTWMIAGPVAGVMGSISLWRGERHARSQLGVALVATGVQIVGNWTLVATSPPDLAAHLLRGAIAVALLVIALRIRRAAR